MPTTNPVPSTDPTDLLFNAGKLDEVVNGAGSTYTDRLGVTRRTLGGIDAEAENRMDAIDAAAIAQRDNIQDAADLVLAAAGYAPPVAYAAGIGLTLQTQTVSYNGDTYAPKQSELPFTTSGTFEAAKFRLIQGVASADLALSSGASLVGYDGGTVQDALDTLIGPTGAGSVGYAPAGTGAVATTVQAKLRETVSVKDFGAKGDGVTDDRDAIQAAFDYAIANNKDLFVPAGTYFLNVYTTAARFININFTASGQSLRVFGEGRGKTVFKDANGTVDRGGRFARTFGIDLTGKSYAIKELLFCDITFDKNGRSMGTPPAPFDWEQAHVVDCYASSWVGITPTFDSIRFLRTEFVDRVAGGYRFATQMFVDSVVIDDLIDEGQDARFGFRAGLELTLWCENQVIQNSQCTFQNEPTAGYEASEGKKRIWKVLNSKFKIFDAANSVSGNEDHYFVYMDKCEVTSLCYLRNVNGVIQNSTITTTSEWWGKNLTFRSCVFKMPYTAGTNTHSPLYLGHQRLNGPRILWTVDSCRFVLDTTDPAVAASNGFQVQGNTLGATQALGHCVTKIMNCEFDVRCVNVIGAQGGGSWELINNKFRSSGFPVRVGLIDGRWNRVLLRNNDYSQTGGTYLIDDQGITVTSADTAYWIDETLDWDAIEAAGKTLDRSGSFVTSEYVKQPPVSHSDVVPTKRSANGHIIYKRTVPTAGYQAWVRRANAWVPYLPITSKNTTANRPTLTSADVGFMYLDTTIDADGKPIWWTGTTWVDATGATV